MTIYLIGVVLALGYCSGLFLTGWKRTKAKPDEVDYSMAAAISMGFAMVWPISLVIFLLYLVSQKLWKSGS